MLIGYARVSKQDGTQSLDLQVDALLAAGVAPGKIYTEELSGRIDNRPELAQCLKAMNPGDVLVVWKLDRLGRSLRHLVNLVEDLNKQEKGLRVLTGHGAAIDTSTPSGKLVFGIFAALAEYEAELIRERTNAGLVAARARGRKGGRPFRLVDPVHLETATSRTRQSTVEQIAKSLGVSESTIYRARRRHHQPQAETAD